MPLHLLGKKSWNVYNPANIARVEADKAAAAAREAAEEQRMQEYDAARRAAILRGQTPPPLPEPISERGNERERKRTDRANDGHDRKAKRIRGEDDTDRDIRLARTATGPKHEDQVALLQLRKPGNDAPLTDHAGHINLFPVDPKEAVKLQKNAEAEKEKKRKEQAIEDQYTMRLSNAAGKGGFEQPWYTAGSKTTDPAASSADTSLEAAGFGSTDVWGNPDPQRKERQKGRIVVGDPLVFMKQATGQLKRHREAKKKQAEERKKELQELRAAEERRERRHRHSQRKERRDDRHRPVSPDNTPSRRESSSRRHHRHQSRSRSPARGHHRTSHRHERGEDGRDNREQSHEHKRRRLSVEFGDKGRGREHGDRKGDGDHESGSPRGLFSESQRWKEHMSDQYREREYGHREREYEHRGREYEYEHREREYGCRERDRERRHGSSLRYSE